MTAIRAAGIRKTYGDTTVLDGIDVALQPGQAVALLGPNGAGKTTTVEILMGFVDRDGGTVEVLGVDPASQRGDSWRSRVGMVVQQGRDRPKWRVHEFLRWIHAHYPEGPRLRSVDEMLDAFELHEHAHKTLVTLSGGLRRRLDLAAALIARPDLLVLDEPTTGLDPVAKRAVHDIVADQIDTGTALLLTTHDLAEADRLAGRILILNRGTIVAEGSPDQLRRQVESNVEITWNADGAHHVHVTTAPEAFVRDLLRDDVTGLEVRRTSLEDAYLALVDPNPDSHKNLIDEEASR
ncbi:ABC transporter ATP-binding protein [Tessaracoccus caeni]|uniref:ABC transporter ATP-binding protein n=1 Tax=Tessaracoccus caeni TaxID=3031239 RepID=UPI0023D9BDDC|nr:ABC transporter ATP-binding protein [Tessaracoccus caeni]MDF1487198.1 ABC transporter ATP-binding protein [Tessaracoccus caeni]